MKLVEEEETQYQHFPAPGSTLVNEGTRRLIKDIVKGGSGGPDHVTTLSYYGDPTDAASYGKLEEQIDSDGSWERYEYSAAGNAETHKVITPFLDAAPGAPEANCRVLVVTIRPDNPRTEVTETLAGTLVRHETETLADVNGTMQWTVTGQQGGESFTEKEIDYPEEGAGVASDRMKAMLNRDGTGSLHTYADLGGGSFTETTRTGPVTDSSAAGFAVDAREIVTQTYNAQGNVIEESRQVAGPGLTGGSVTLVAEAWAASGVDALGRVTEKTWSAPYAATSSTSYICCGVGEEVDRNGTRTNTLYDVAKRPFMTVTTYPGGRTETTETKWLKEGDKLVTETWRQGVLQDRTVETLTGERLETATPDADGDGAMEVTTTSTAYNPDGSQTVTETDPTGATTITTTHRDGRMKSVTGTAVPDEFHTYAMHAENGGGVKETTYRSSANSPEWMATYRDAYDRVFKQQYPATDGQSGDPTATTTFYPYSAGAGVAGRTHVSTDLEGVSRSFSYSDGGDTTTETMPVGSGKTRTMISQNRFVAGDPQVGDANMTRTLVNGVITSTDYRSMDGLSSKRQGFNRKTVSVFTRPDSSGLATQTVTQPDGTKSVAVLKDERRMSQTTWEAEAGIPSAASLLVVNPGSLPSGLLTGQSFTYDAQGRTLTQADSRTGPTTFGNFTGAGQPRTMTDPGNRVTTYAFDRLGRQTVVDAPDTDYANVTHTSYYPDGTTKAQWGNTYPVAYTYDDQQRQTTLHTWRDNPPSGEPAPSGGDVTTWTYDAARGWLERKQYADGKGTDYQYTPGGQLATRTLARGVVTTFGYDAGQLASVTYSDGTPTISYTFDGFGRLATVTDATGTRNFAYRSDNLQLDTETLSPFFGGKVITQKHDSLDRPIGLSIGSDYDVTYGYQASSGRFGSMTSGTHTFTYGYVPGSSLVASVAGPFHTVTNTYETTRDVLNRKTNSVGSTVVSAYQYAVDAVGQRTGVDQSGTAFAQAQGVSWGYDALGQVTAADSDVDNAQDRGYLYDAIGNRKKSAAGTTNPNASGATTYAVNALNQYEEVQTGASVVEPLHDEDGNLTENGQFKLTWNGENQLVAVRNAGDALIATYVYDYLGRRTRKTTTASAPQGATDIVTIYNGWNPVARYEVVANQAATLQKTFVWGLDLSGSLAGAGGVGGLLAVTDAVLGQTYRPTFDGNGNVSEYLNTSGAIVAHYEYDTFGNLVVATGSRASGFEFEFSSKELDPETDFSYYGYRFYEPETGTWLTRDPIEERGGVNLYGFVSNRPTISSDGLGLAKTDFKDLGYQKGYDVIYDDGRKGHVAGATKPSGIHYESSKVIADEDSEGNYKIEISGVEVHGTYWWEDQKSKTHEEHHVELWGNEAQSFEDAVKKVSGCKAKVNCYRKLVLAWALAMDAEAKAKNKEFDCDEYGGKYPSVCQNAKILRTDADSKWKEMQNKFEKCDQNK